MDQSTRDRICSRSWTDGQVAVEINWTGPVTLICLSCQSCQFGQARSDQISADAVLLACLLSQSLPTTTLSSCDLDNLIQTNRREARRYCPLLSAPDGKGREGSHSQGPQSSEAGTINRWQVTSTSPRRSNTGGAELVPGGGGANMALCLEKKLKVRSSFGTC